jgi:hypothetical protein
MKRRTLALFCISVVAAAQISLPRIGFVRDREGALRPLLGVAGAFVLGDPILTGVVAAGSFGNEYALAATASEVVLIQGDSVVWRRSLPGGEAFGFRKNGRPEWVRFANGSCLIWPDKGEPELASLCENPAPPEQGRDSEPVTPQWVLRRTSERLYLMQAGTGEPLFELPEAPL